MHIFELNEDVLRHIISMTNRGALFKLAATSHFAWDLCISYIICDVHITYSSIYPIPYRLQNFCHFMLACPAERIPCLRHLNVTPTLVDWSDGSIVIASPPTVQAALSLLADVLDQALNLRSFEMQDCESVLECEPRIADALARCTCLTTISLDNHFLNPLGPHSMAMMQNLTSIRHINFGITYDATNALFFAPRSTLESASFHTGYGFSIDTRLQWPHVSRLTLHVQAPMNLAHPFPNVRELRAHGNNHAATPRKWFHAHLYEDWSLLDYVEGSVQALYLLRLTSHIRELRVSSLTHNEPKRPRSFDFISRTDAFLDLVRVANPEALSFEINLQSKLADITFFHALARAAPTLKYLAISVTYSKTVIDDLTISLKALHNVPLIFLTVCIKGHSFKKTRPLSNKQWEGVFQPFASLILSIEYIELANIQEYWAVKTDVNARHLCKISGAEGERAKKRWSKCI
ncbi:hypothetical protein PILCRDRAFT_379786 [Piloderma croceum F 1598]|uniref:F-box domain-containing protein n=1 Tax=Piloderma croceum (strain F 1598) TaxID=765440 RepID=A0A0C3FLT4_PILCF|nr:hypothetical protein PILCRDRAFT_379786 [Piloderma croceum F 1598]